MIEDCEALWLTELCAKTIAILFAHVHIGWEIAGAVMSVRIDTFQFVVECIGDVQLRGWIMKGNAERML